MDSAGGPSAGRAPRVFFIIDGLGFFIDEGGVRRRPVLLSRPTDGFASFSARRGGTIRIRAPVHIVDFPDGHCGGVGDAFLCWLVPAVFPSVHCTPAAGLIWVSRSAVSREPFFRANTRGKTRPFVQRPPARRSGLPGALREFVPARVHPSPKNRAAAVKKPTAVRPEGRVPFPRCALKKPFAKRGHPLFYDHSPAVSALRNERERSHSRDKQSLREVLVGRQMEKRRGG